MQNHYSTKHAGRASPSGAEAAPNAALLIDFDNVTMGMRSDLAKELKNLLDSDIIKGKVTVQRAYADWRRYPQYIVPLSEASIDLIFAPAYGSSKKNATDIRMAIDGMELVFIRPEIGTFILLTGDSDFSSLVLKLKEYGKYVIGIGLQESSSDILVQNCDEYYSYTSLTGLSRTSEGGGPEKPDPWQCVSDAMARMTARGDVMRSDRLKQVMIEIAPDFDESNLGYRKFSKFLFAAANKGLLRIERGENGQYSVAPPGGAGAAKAPAGKAKGEGKASASGKTQASGKALVAARAPAAEKAPAAAQPAAKGRSAAKRSRAPATDQASAGAASPASGDRTGTGEAAVNGESGRPPAADPGPALDLLRRVLRESGDKGRQGVRDSEVKRRLLALDEGFDESALGFSKFGKFLHFARDSGAVSLAGLDGGGYEVRLTADGRRGSTGASSKDGGRPRDRRRRSGESKSTAAKSGVDAKAMGLPTTTEAATSYLAHSYRGVGVKTAKTLVETFGDDLFGVLQDAPDKVRALLPRGRAERVLSAWREDYGRRKAAMPAQPAVRGGGPPPRAQPKTDAPTPPRREPANAVQKPADAIRERAGAGAAAGAGSRTPAEKKSSPGLMGLFRRRGRGDGGG